jgi:prepilin-type N-terminal cleavage/methylation domain-containing protein
MRPSNRGFTLIEIVVVIVVLAILIAMAAALTRGVAAAQKRSLTATRIQTVDAALVQFVTQQKRLPCPANGTRRTGIDADVGTETARNAGTGCTTNQQDGVVPWRALGLSENDATDGWDRRLTYRVFPALTADNGMNMSWCDPAGGAAAGALPNVCNTACVSTDMTTCTSPSSFLANRGLEVRDASGIAPPARLPLMDPAATPHTGAAYVVISPGESGGGGYLSSGQLGSSSIGTDGNEEMRNYASLPYAGVATFYVDDSLNETATTAHFDDLVSRPSLLSVITKAGLGPRSH